MMGKTKIKKELSKELNNLLGLSVDWSKLRQRDLEEVHRFLVDELTIPRAINLTAATFRLRLESTPLLRLLKERMQVNQKEAAKRRESSCQSWHPPLQHPPLVLQPVLHPPGSLQSPSLQQKKQVPDYIR